MINIPSMTKVNMFSEVDKCHVDDDDKDACGDRHQSMAVRHQSSAVLRDNIDSKSLLISPLHKLWVLAENCP